MTSKADISPANWAALVDAAPAIARAVSASAGGDADSVAELDAFIQFVSGAGTDTAGSSVLDRIIADVRARLATGVEPTGGEVYMDGLERARRAGAVAAVELEPEEATALRAWYLAVAQRVAAARREGGALGIGGQDISTWERDTMQAIADALGV